MGVTLENGKRYTQVFDHMVRVSMASLDPNDTSDGAVTVMIDHEKSEFVLCTLIPSKIVQQPLDLQFSEGEEVTLFLNGHGTVHLTGYDDDGQPDDDDESDDEMEPTELSESQVRALIQARNNAGNKGLKRKAVEMTKASKAKQLKHGEDENEDSSDEDSSDKDSIDDEDDENEMESTQHLDDEDDDDDDEEEDDEDSDEDNSEDDSDDDLFVKNEARDKRGPNATPGKGFGPVSGNKAGWNTPKQQQKQHQQKQSPKHTPKAPTISDSKAKGEPGGKTPKAQHSQTPKGHPGQAQKEQVKQAQSPKMTPGQKPNQSNTPALNGNNSLQETGSGKKRRRQRNKGNNSPISNDKPSIDKESDKVAKGTPTEAKPKQTLSGGVIIEDLKVGNGPVAKSGKFIHVYYTGRLVNGKEFDSTGDGKPFKFRLGNNDVIKGWDTGLQGMKVGGTRKITVPPSLGYGSKSIGKIPSNSTLIFDVRLAAVN